MDKLLYGLLGIVILLVMFLVADFATGESKTMWCKVIEKNYTPSQTSTGYATNGNGGMVTTTTSEKLTLILELPNGTVETKDVSLSLYCAAKLGEKAQVRFRIGGISGNLY